ILLKESEYKRLCDEFGKEKAEMMINEVNEVFAIKPKVRREYKDGDHNRLIRNWYRRGYFNHLWGGGSKSKTFTSNWRNLIKQGGRNEGKKTGDD
ncbi:MAG: hypothetical protein D6726_12815, partial [Nitrospirae bacterium]